MNTAKDELLGKGWYSDIEEQIQFGDTTMEQCHLVALRAWDKVGEPRLKGQAHSQRLYKAPEKPLLIVFTKISLSCEQRHIREI